MANQEPHISPHTINTSRTLWWDSWEAFTCNLRLAILSKAPDSELHKLLTDCLALYSASLTVSTIDEAFSIVAGDQCSPLETAFMWLGRWRPTSAVVLVYSTMGVEFQRAAKEAHTFHKYVSDTTVLSERQLSGLIALQNHSRQAESDLSKQLATLQMLLVDQTMVTALRLGGADGDFRDLSKAHQIIDLKLSELQTLLMKADNLRLHTLKVLLDLLTPVQAASCSVAAYELTFALKMLGKDFLKSGAATMLQ